MSMRYTSQIRPLGVIVKLAAVNDLGRAACTFDTSITTNLYAFKKGDDYRILSRGEFVGELNIFYYRDFSRLHRFGRYSPGSQYSAESFQLVDTAESDHQWYSMPIIELAHAPFQASSAVRGFKMLNIHIRDYTSIIRGLINKSIQNESMGRIYTFTHKGHRYVGSFELLSDENRTVFTYAKAGSDNVFAFYSYDYAADRIGEADHVGANNFIYLRVINLAEPFWFFRPE